MVRLQASELVTLCINAIAAFQSVKQVKTLDAHLDEFIANRKGIDLNDQTFVRQVVYGVDRYKKLIKVIISSFYFKHSAEVSLQDRTRYCIFAYLSTMRLDELGWPAFEKLVIGQDQRTIYVFLNYLFSAHNLQNWMKPEWLKIFDEDYIDTVLIGGVLKWAEPASDLLTYLEEKVYNIQPPKDDTSDKEAGVTVPEPFNLTQPKPRMVPAPDAINCTPVASKLNTKILDPNYKPAVDSKIKSQLAQNAAELAKKYDPSLEFRFETASRVGAARPENTQTYYPRIKQAVEKERAAELQFDVKPVKKPPTAPTAETAPIKLNTAAILREDNVYRKKQAQEAAMIKRYESELRDGSEFEDWKRRMEEADEEERIKEVNRRRIEMALSQEQAIEARKRKVRENRVAAKMQQAELAVVSEKSEAEHMEEYLQKKLLVDDVIESRAAVPEARQHMLNAAAKRAQAIRQETEQIELEREKQMAQDLDMKRDLIRQIKALENVPIERVTKYDPTYTPGHMLLEEMSLAELKERLAFNTRRDATLREEKRENILKERKEKEDDLARRADRLNRIRSQASAEGTARRREKERKARDLRLAEKAKSDEAALKLQAELEQKRAARKAEDERLAAELKEISIKKQYLDADASKVEETKYKELQMGFEREIKARQTCKQHEQAIYEATRATEVNLRTKNLKAAQRETHAFRRDYDERVADGLTKAEQLKRNELAYNQSMVAMEHTRAAITIDDREVQFPYGTGISQRETMTGRAYATKIGTGVSPARNLLDHTAGDRRLQNSEE
eukprot:SAG31_NODE_5210_length_2674_cov_1.231845_1_plen_790_part_10